MAYFAEFKQTVDKDYFASYLSYGLQLTSSDTELLLAEIAMQLHSGNIYSFYEMLKFMKNPAVCGGEVCHLASEIRKKTRKFKPQMLSDTSVGIHPYDDGRC